MRDAVRTRRGTIRSYYMSIGKSLVFEPDLFSVMNGCSIKRELARQTSTFMKSLAQAAMFDHYPEIRILACIGGESVKNQIEMIKRGVHVVVATPGRLIDMLDKKIMNLNVCRYLCFDEADRMIDMGFEEEVRNIISYFKVI